MPENNTFIQPENQTLAEPTQKLEDIKEVKDVWTAPQLGTAEEQRQDFNVRVSGEIADSVFEKINSENEEQLAQGLIARADANPAKYLSAAKTAEALNIKDVDLVYDNFDEFEQQRKAQAKERYIKQCDVLKDMCVDDPEMLAKLDDVSAGQLKRISDNLAIYGQTDEKSGLSGRWARTSYTYKRAEKDFQVNNLANDIIGKTGAARAEAIRLYREAAAEVEAMPQIDASGWSAGDLALNAVEQLPYQARTTGAMIAGTAAGAISGAALSPAGAVVAGIAGNAAGRATAFYVGYKAESGNMMRELLDMKDNDGKPLDDDIVDLASRFYGAFSGAIEQIGAEALMKTMGLSSITKAGTKAAIKNMLKDGTKRQLFTNIAKDFLGAIGSEGAEESMQQLLQSGVERTAKDFASLARGDNYEQENVIDALIDDLSQAGEAGLQGMKASVVMAGAPSAVRGTVGAYRQQRALSSKVKEIKATADMQVLDNTQKEVQAYAESPAFEPKTLNALFQRAKRSSIYQDIFASTEEVKALMESEAMQQHKQTLQQNGMWADLERQIAEGEELGNPVRIGFADFGEKIMPSPELYAAWKDIIKTYEDGVTIKEIKAAQANRANWLAEGQKRAANKDANFEFAYKKIIENESYAAMPDLQKKQIAELQAGILCYAAEQTGSNIQEIVNKYAPQFELSLDGKVGSDANVRAIIGAVRDEAAQNETQNLINVSKHVARKDINAIKKLLLSKIDNPNTADVKKYVQIVNAIGDMKLNIAGMSDEDIINHLAEYTKSGELKLEINRNDSDRAKSGLYSASETALADIQANTGGGDYVLVGGGRVPVNYEIAELNDMITSHDDAGAVNANYPQELQQRDRSRSASDVQITNIVNNFAPERVGKAEIATEGAPIVTKDGFVAVGNGRAMAIRQVYNNEQTAQKYKDYLTGKGFDLTGFDKPVLVRRLAMDMTGEQLKALVDDANTAGTMQYSDSENALRDAAKMSGNLIDLLDIEADIDSAANRRFLNGFFAEVVPTAERNAYLDKDDKITRKGVERVENALVAKLLPDARFLSVLVENPDNNIRKVTKSLAKAAPAIIGFENDIAAGRISAEYSVAGDVAGAVDVLKRAKDRGMSASDFIKMTDMFAEPIEASTQTMVNLFENTTGATDFLNKILNYIHNASDQGDLQQGSMFAAEPLTKLQLLEREAAQQSLLQQSTDIAQRVNEIDRERLEFERQNINPELKGKEQEKVKAVEINRFFADRKTGKDISDNEVIAALDKTVEKNANGIRVLKNDNGETVTLSNKSIIEMLATTKSSDNIGGIVNKEAIANLPALFKTAIKIKETGDIRHGKDFGIIRYANVIMSAGEPIMVKITVKSLKGNRRQLTDIEFESNGNRDLSAYSLKTAKKNTAVGQSLGTTSVDKSYGKNNSSTDISISDLIDYVNSYTAEKIKIDGKDKAVRNSAGQRIAKTEEGLRAFYEWFGDSEVVDKRGRPLVVYHGTLNKFDAFSKKMIGSRYVSDDKGFFFIDKENIAKDYARSDFDADKKGFVMPVYISAKKPLIINAKWAKNNGLGSTVFDREDSISFWDNYQSFVLEEIEKNKSDSVIVDDGKAKMVVAFSPIQIKSVNNIGSFSRKNDNIYYQMAGISSATADMNALARAREMRNEFIQQHYTLSNEDMEAIRRQTGWSLSPDGSYWFYEISDKDAKINEYALRRSQTTLGELFDHPKLYEAYPFVRDLTVYLKKSQSDTAGAYSQRVIKDRINGGYKKENSITLNTRFDKSGYKSTLLHEIKHAIEHKEDWYNHFTTGYVNRKAANEEYKQISADGNELLSVLTKSGAGKLRVYSDIFSPENETILQKYKKEHPDEKKQILERQENLAYNLIYSENGLANYIHQENEVTARNVSARGEMSEEELKRTPFQNTADVAYVIMDGQKYPYDLLNPDGAKITVSTNRFIRHNGREYPAKMLYYYARAAMKKLTGRKVKNASLGNKVIEIRPSSVEKYDSLLADPKKQAVVDAVPDMLAIAEFVPEKPYNQAVESNIKAYWKADLPIGIDSEIYNAHLTVKEDNNGNYFYDLQIKESPRTAPVTNPVDKGLISDSSDTNSNVTPNGQNVKQNQPKKQRIAYNGDLFDFQYDSLVVTPKIKTASRSETYFQSAFAGSRVDYDRPSLEAIGSGEGNQAHGWGLYYALNKDVAERYRRVFTNDDFKNNWRIAGTPLKEMLGDLYNYDTFSMFDNVFIRYQSPDADSARNNLLTALYNVQRFYADKVREGRLNIFTKEVFHNPKDAELREKAENLRNEIATYRSDDFTVEKGQVHEVDIPENPYLLDEQKPFSKQSLLVKKALRKLFKDKGQNLTEVMKTGYVNGNPKGGSLYDEIVSLSSGSQKEASLLLERYGIKGITYDGRRDGRCFVIFDPDDVKVIQKFYQTENQTADGAALGAYMPLQRKIVLFRGHNLSTIIHESGHWWLDTLSQIAQSEQASDKLRDDWATIKDWLGVGEDNVISTEQHEKFARGVEAYFLTHKAPSSRLAQLFDTLRRWLASVYKDVRELDVELNDDVVRVFDHMLASSAEIEEYKQAHALKSILDRADAFGLSGKDFEKYREMADSALTLAQDKHFNDKMLLMYREETETYNKLKDKLAQTVLDEWCNDKYNRAIYAIYRGKVGDIDIGTITINENEARELFGENLEYLQKRDGKPIYAPDGLSMEQVADLVGLSPDELKGTLLSVRNRTRKYKEMLNRRVHEELGDPVSYDDVQKQVIKAVYNEKQASLLQFELNQIGKSLGHKNVLEQSYELYAHNKIAGTTIRELKPQNYAEAAQKAGDRALAALERGNRNEAYRQKEMQVRNFYLYREAQKQADTVEKLVKRLKQIGKKEVNTGVDQTYQDAARALLSKVNLARVLNSKQRERLGDLSLWIMEQRQNGYEIVVPDKFKEQINAVNYTDLQLEDFLALADSVKSLIHNGRDIKEFELAGQLVDREKLLAEMKKTLDTHKAIKKSPSSRKNLAEIVGKQLRGWDSFLTGLGFLSQRVDNGDTNGVFHKTFLRPLADAQTLENDLQVKYAGKIRELTAGLSKETKARMREFVPEAEKVLHNQYTLEDLISIGLNMGNRENLQRLQDGNGFNDNQLNWVKNYLTQEHWDYIQAIWDVLESMYPMLEEHHKKMSGLDMDKVFPVPVQTSYGQYKGGYFPIVYDRELSADVEVKAALYDDDYNVATTSKGYTKKRAAVVNAPLKLGLMNVAQHMNTVLHDVAYRGTLRKLWNLANNPEFVEMFDGHIGKEYRDGLNELLKTLGNEPNRETRGLSAWEKCLRLVRQRATLIGLGFRLTTALSQPLGFFSSIATMTEQKQKHGGTHGGAYWVAVGHKELLTNPKIYDWAMANSGELRVRLGNQDASIAKRIKELTKTAGNMSFKEQAETWAYKAIGYMDFYVATVTWLGAYRQATTDLKMSHEDAVFYADRIMLNSQGTGTTKDTAGMQRANEGWRAMTMFYSFFSALYQMSIQFGRDVRNAKSFGDYADLSARFMAMYVLPSCLDSIMRGEMPDDDDDESYMAWLFDNTFGYFIGGVPVLRDVYSGLKYNNSGSTNIGRQVNYLGGFYAALAKAFDGDASWQKLTKGAMNSFAAITGYPTGGQIADTASYFAGVAAGEIKPHSLTDLLWGIYKGKERK